jgi:hypothetical protein
MMFVAYYASLNGDSGERECATKDEAEYWESIWRNSGGRIATVFQRKGKPTIQGERPITRYGKPVKTKA